MLEKAPKVNKAKQKFCVAATLCFEAKEATVNQKTQNSFCLHAIVKMHSLS